MRKILNRLFEHQTLTQTEASEVMLNIGNGKYNEAELAAFMSVYLMRSIALEEIIGFRDALLEMALPIDLSAYNPIDIVGTGGDGKNTFNISTAACLVLAGAGYNVAKHGNYGTTSVSGSSSVLEYLGAKFTNQSDLVKNAIERTGFTYLHAPLWSPAMKNIAIVRKELGVRSFFNVLGPLISPVKPQNQCLGVYNLKMMRLYNYIYQNLGFNYTIIHTLDGYDEISLTTTSKIINNTGEYIYTPEELGFDPIEQTEIWGGNTVKEAAQIFTNVLNNQSTKAQKNVVAINAALAIQTLQPNKSIEICLSEAYQSIENGKAMQALKHFIEIYQ